MLQYNNSAAEGTEQHNMVINHAVPTQYIVPRSSYYGNYPDFKNESGNDVKDRSSRP